MLTEIIKGLAGTNPEEQDAAEDKLSELGKQGLSLQEGLEALSAAAGSFPPRRLDFCDSCADLIEAAAELPQPEYVSAIMEHFSLYSERGKESALRLLTKLPQREAAEAYMELLRRHLRQGEIARLLLEPLKSEPRYPEVFFPEILDYADIEGFEWDINMLLLYYLDKALIAPEALAVYREKLLEQYGRLAERLMPMQSPEGVAWMWEESYEELRSRGALYLDLLGRFPEPHVLEVVRQALSFADPRLKYFAVLALIRRGNKIEAKHLVEVAASAEMRNYLFGELQDLGKLSLFPEKFKTQSALAESNMVNWLIYPTELGRAPDEIELMQVVTTDTDAGLADYYVFRFRTLEPHWGAKDGWMAGISGPFLQKDGLSTISGGDTFSRFEPWDSKTPEEHVEAVIETLDKWVEGDEDDE
jgi:hypothetical protein